MNFPQKTIKTIIESLRKFSITNPVMQIGILSVVSTEGGFFPRSELSYKNTANQRLRALFGSRLPKSEDELTDLKKDDVAFYEAIYGGKYGNTEYGDGYKYRGRGFNGITFKSLYKKYGDMIGVDLVKSPDRLNEITIAADCLAAYFAEGIKNGRKKTKEKYGVDDTNQLTSIPIAVKIAFSANAGWGTNWEANKVLRHEHLLQLKNSETLEKIVNAL